MRGLSHSPLHASSCWHGAAQHRRSGPCLLRTPLLLSLLQRLCSTAGIASAQQRQLELCVSTQLCLRHSKFELHCCHPELLWLSGLQALFRPITVVVPDRQLIMENMLMAEGFVEAKMLAKKFASLYYLLEDLLSPAK